jgi:hypothetical protein
MATATAPSGNPEFLAFGTADPTNGAIQTLDLMYDPKGDILNQPKIGDLKKILTAAGVGTDGSSGKVIIDTAVTGDIPAKIAQATKASVAAIGGSRKRSPKKKTQKRGGKRQKGGKSRRV